MNPKKRFRAVLDWFRKSGNVAAVVVGVFMGVDMLIALYHENLAPALLATFGHDLVRMKWMLWPVGIMLMITVVLWVIAWILRGLVKILEPLTRILNAIGDIDERLTRLETKITEKE